MKQPPRQRTIKDERDEKIGKDAKVYAFEWIIAITQVLTIMYEAKPFKQVGIVFLIIGIALLIWFGITG